MTDFLTGIMTLPKLVQRSLAFGLGIIGILLVLLILLSGMQALEDLQNSIEEGRSNLARLEQLIAQRPADNGQPAVQQSDITAVFLPGENIAVIQAGLQTRVNAIASAQGAIVASVGNAPVIAIDDMQYAGVRVDIQGNLPSISNTLFDLETSLPPLIIKEATIRGTNPAQKGGSVRPVELAGEIVIYGAVGPKGMLPNPDGAKQ